MEIEQYQLLARSMRGPLLGEFELYKPGEIGSARKCRIEGLESVPPTLKIPRSVLRPVKGRKELEIPQQKCGIAFMYGAHETSIRLQLIATMPSPLPDFRYEGKKRIDLPTPEYVGSLAFFTYLPRQTKQLGKQIVEGKNVGPLEHKILQEILHKEPCPEEIRQKIGTYMVALGEFSLEMHKRKQRAC